MLARVREVVRTLLFLIDDVCPDDINDVWGY